MASVPFWDCKSSLPSPSSLSPTPSMKPRLKQFIASFQAQATSAGSPDATGSAYSFPDDAKRVPSLSNWATLNGGNSGADSGTEVDEAESSGDGGFCGIHGQICERADVAAVCVSNDLECKYGRIWCPTPHSGGRFQMMPEVIESAYLSHNHHNIIPFRGGTLPNSGASACRGSCICKMKLAPASLATFLTASVQFDGRWSHEWTGKIPSQGG